VVFDKKKAATPPERVEKNTLIYCMSRRDLTLSGKMSSSFKLRNMYVGAGASAVERQLLLRCRNYATVKYIRRNCRNYGRKAPGPVVIHRQGYVNYDQYGLRYRNV